MVIAAQRRNIVLVVSIVNTFGMINFVIVVSVVNIAIVGLPATCVVIGMCCWCHY